MARPLPGSPLVTARLLHAALMGSLLMYGLVFYVVVVRGPEEAAPAANAPLIERVLIFVALGLMLAIPLLRKTLRGGDGVKVAPQKWLTISLVSWAMCESIGVLGLVAGFLTHATWTYPAFGAAALVNMLLYRPTPSQFADWVARPESEPQ